MGPFGLVLINLGQVKARVEQSNPMADDTKEVTGLSKRKQEGGAPIPPEISGLLARRPARAPHPKFLGYRRTSRR